MENEEKKVDEVKTSSTEENYIETIKNLKNNTVSKEAYDELAQQNKELLDAFLNDNRPKDEQEEKKVDTEAIIKELRDNPHLTNLEFVTDAVTLRKALINEGKNDIFVPQGSSYTPTDEDFAAAEKVASVFEECIELADGDPATFTFELQKRMAEMPPVRR